MPLPETIRVKYTEEEAEYVSIRPLVQQEFRGAELVDMILSVTGKDVARIQQILRSGTIVFHSYRYWWQGFEAETGGARGDSGEVSRSGSFAGISSERMLGSDSGVGRCASGAFDSIAPRRSRQEAVAAFAQLLGLPDGGCARGSAGISRVFVCASR